MNGSGSGRWLSVVFLALWTLDSLLGENLFYVGGLGVYYHLPIMMSIIMAGGLAFLVSPRLGRAKILTVQSAVLLVPVVFPVVWSLMIWVITSAGISGIRRGFVSSGYLFFGILAIAATAYAVGERVVGIYLFSLVAANLLIVVRVIGEDGMAAFLSDFAVLLYSFAETTGDTMKKLEIHRITYGLGPFLVCYFVKGSRMKKIRWLFPGALFCYLTGFKRTGVIAVAAAVITGWMVCALKKRRAARLFLLRAAGVGFVIFSLLYVAAVYFGLFEFVESLGINTNMRPYIYSLFRPYYHISPFFLGYGTGWVDDLFRNIQQGISGDLGGVAYNTHNDYLRSYIELGMIGFVIWCCTKFNLQVSRSYRFLGTDGGNTALALFTYMAITSLTDPTSMQVYINCAIASILCGFRLETREKMEERELEIHNRYLSEKGF